MENKWTNHFINMAKEPVQEGFRMLKRIPQEKDKFNTSTNEKYKDKVKKTPEIESVKKHVIGKNEETSQNHEDSKSIECKDDVTEHKDDTKDCLRHVEKSQRKVIKRRKKKAIARSKHLINDFSILDL